MKNSKVWKNIVPIFAFAKTIVYKVLAIDRQLRILSYRWFFAPQFQTHTSLPKSFP